MDTRPPPGRSQFVKKKGEKKRSVKKIPRLRFRLWGNGCYTRSETCGALGCAPRAPPLSGVTHLGTARPVLKLRTAERAQGFPPPAGPDASLLSLPPPPYSRLAEDPRRATSQPRCPSQ